MIPYLIPRIDELLERAMRSCGPSTRDKEGDSLQTPFWTVSVQVAATFQHLMDQVLMDLCVLHLRFAGFTSSPNECNQTQSQVEYLEYEVGHGQVKTLSGESGSHSCIPSAHNKEEGAGFCRTSGVEHQVYSLLCRKGSTSLGSNHQVFD